MNWNPRQPTHEVIGNPLDPQMVLPFTGLNALRKIFEGYEVKMNSLRYQTFCKSLICVCCGLVGKVFLLELPAGDERPHFNLYGKREGRLVQLTKDHIQPLGRGGKNHIDNLQTMCHVCNELKASRQSHMDDLRRVRDGSQTIYIISCSYTLCDILQGFATTEKGVKQIVEDHQINLAVDPTKFSIQVDMEKMRVVLEEADGFKQRFYIHEMERV